MSYYCLLCDQYISHPAYQHHNYHRYYSNYYIEYFKTKGNRQIYNNDGTLIISILTVDLPKDSEILFKGLHIWEMAKPVYDKLKVFK